MSFSQELWEEAERLPLYGHLLEKRKYVFKAIKQPSALLEEILDESQRICDVQPYFAIFKITERQENESEDTNLNKNINSLIGKKLDDFKTLKNPEVIFVTFICAATTTSKQNFQVKNEIKIYIFLTDLLITQFPG